MNRDDAEDLLFNEAILNRIQNSLQNTNPFDPQTIFHQPAPPNPKKRPRVMERSSYKTAKDYALGISSEQERKIVQAQNAQGYYCFLIGSYGSIASYAVRKSMSLYKIFDVTEDVGLRMDIECYPPELILQTAAAFSEITLPDKAEWEKSKLPSPNNKQEDYIVQFKKAIDTLLLALVHFCQRNVDVDLDTLNPKNSFGVDIACQTGSLGKLSAHIVSPALCFENNSDIRHFMYYFMADFLRNPDIPIWMKCSPKPLTDDDIKEMDTWCYDRKQTNFYNFFRHLHMKPKWEASAIDTGIYNTWNTLRCTGSGKKGNTRILIPYMGTDFWAARVQKRYLDKAVLLKPTADARIEWMIAFLTLAPSGHCHIKPLWPFDSNLQIPTGYVTKRWLTENPRTLSWKGKTKDEVKFPRAPWRRRSLLAPILTLLDETKKSSSIALRKFKTLDKAFFEDLDRAFENLPANKPSRYILLSFLMEFHALQTIRDDTEKNNKILALLKELKAVLPNLPKIVEDGPIPPDLWHDNSTIYVNSNFLVYLPHKSDPVPLMSIYQKTAIFCPVHEAGSTDHNPSAYVTVDPRGVHSIHCSVCNISTNGACIIEDVNFKSDDISQLAPNNTTFINEQYITADMIVAQLREKEIAEQHSILVVSQMGTRKTSMAAELIKTNGKELLDGVHLQALKEGRARSSDKTKIVAILPRELITVFISEQLNLKCSYDIINNRKFKDVINETLTQELRLGICLPSTPKIAGSTYEIVVIDEALQVADLMVSKLVRDSAHTTLHRVATSFNGIMSRANIHLLLGADMDCPSAQALLPNVDFTDPSQCTIIINTGGKGGLIDSNPFYCEDLNYSLNMLRFLVGNVPKTKVLFIPTNQVRAAMDLERFLITECAIDPKQILTVHSETDTGVKWFLVKDTAKYLMDNGYRFFIASPTFGTGFSISKGTVHTTFGFFFQYPGLAKQCLQQLARAREPTDVFFYIQPVPKLRTRIGKLQFDTKWTAAKLLKELETRQMGFTRCVEMLFLDDESLDRPEDHKLEQLWAQYAYIRKAEQDLGIVTGAVQIFESVAAITGKTPKPMQEYENLYESQNFQNYEKLTKAFFTRKRNLAKIAEATEEVIAGIAQKPKIDVDDFAILKWAGSHPFKAGKILKGQETTPAEIAKLQTFRIVFLLCIKESGFAMLTSSIAKEAMDSYGLSETVEQLQAIYLSSQVLQLLSGHDVEHFGCLFHRGQVVTSSWYYCPADCDDLVKKLANDLNPFNPKLAQTIVNFLHVKTAASLRKVFISLLNTLGFTTVAITVEKNGVDIRVGDEVIHFRANQTDMQRRLTLASLWIGLTSREQVYENLFTNYKGWLLLYYNPPNVINEARGGSSDIKRYFPTKQIY